MRYAEHAPIYAQVAYDIAARIATGEKSQGERFSGRSLTGASYGVSQETVRRALRMLSEMGIVSIRQNVGVEVGSRKRAAEFVEQYQADNDLRVMKLRLGELVAQRDQLNTQIDAVFQRIVDLEERFRHSGMLRTYEFCLAPASDAVGRSIGELQFWQKTGATVVAVRRGEEIQLSPGPGATLYAGDVLVVACNVADIDKVSALVGDQA